MLSEWWQIKSRQVGFSTTDDNFDKIYALFQIGRRGQGNTAVDELSNATECSGIGSVPNSEATLQR